MRKFVIVAVAAAMLSGCTSTTAPQESAPDIAQSDTVEAGNEIACKQFALDSEELFSAIRASSSEDDSMMLISRASFARNAAIADGEVQEMLTSLVDSWPSYQEIAAMSAVQYLLNDRLDMIARACDSAGTNVTYSKFDLP